MKQPLYDRHGTAIAYIAEDGKSIYLYNGKPVAYLKQGYAYNYSGRYLGSFESGWLYDRARRPALFTRGATGGPDKPTTATQPTAALRALRPLKGTDGAPPD